VIGASADHAAVKRSSIVSFADAVAKMVAASAGPTGADPRPFGSRRSSLAPGPALTDVLAQPVGKSSALRLNSNSSAEISSYTETGEHSEEMGGVF